MTIHVTGVHGIGNLDEDLPEQAASKLSTRWQRALTSALVGDDGLALTVAYYAHHLAVVRQSADDGLDHLSVLEHEWLVGWADQLDALPADLVPQAAYAIPARMLVDFIARKRGLNKHLLRPFVARFLGEVHRYLNPADNPRRTAARATVADTITTHGSRVVIAHSLGTVVAYEALWTIPDHPIDLFITLGSPLGMDGVIFDRLQPAPTPGALGQRPPNVRRWVNIADPGDIVAIPRPFTKRFAPDANHEDVHINWLDPHSVRYYLASKPCVAALTSYLAQTNR